MSAQSNNFRVWYEGAPTAVGGTSCAAPTVAGIVSLLNDARLSAGRPALGFLNPLIYAAGALGFNNITAGNNPGCGTEGFNVSCTFYSCGRWR